MMDQGLVALLDPVGTVYPSYLPEGYERPCITYRLVSETRHYHHGGPTGIVEARYQLTAHADTHEATAALAKEIRQKLSGYSGPMGGGNARAAHCEVQNVFDLGYNIDSEVWQIATDVMVFYLET